MWIVPFRTSKTVAIVNNTLDDGGAITCSVESSVHKSKANECPKGTESDDSLLYLGR